MDGEDADFDPLGETRRDRGLPASASDLDELAPGMRLGRYKLIGRIGGGAMGVVWRARDPQLDRDVAIKVVHPSLARIPDAAVRLLREARALAKVQHSAVVVVHDAGQEDTRLFVAMELVDGTTLGQIIRARRPKQLADWRHTLAIVVEAGRGLAAAHAAGVLHRDFKPENVLVSTTGRVCVADFGLAEIVAGQTSSPRRSSVAEAGDSMRVAETDSLTLTGAVVGTPAYMSPEQLRSGVVDARADQFGFCVTAYEALYAERPFPAVPTDDQTPAQALLAAIEAGAIRPPPRDSAVPRWLRDAIVRGLAPEPALRWPDLRSLLAALAPPRRRGVLIGAAVAAAACAVAIGWTVTRGGDAPVLHRLDPVPMWSRAVSSTDGRWIAYADEDRIYVRELRGAASVPKELRLAGLIDHLEFDGDDRVLVSTPGEAGTVLRRWYFASGATEDVAVFPGAERWFGRAAGGDLVVRIGATGPELVLVTAGTSTLIETLARRFGLLAVAPGGNRIAYLDEDVFRSQIVIHDLARGTRVVSAPALELTGLTWADDDRLIYGTGTTDHPTLWIAAVTRDGLARAVRLWTSELGWFGYLSLAGDRIRFVDTQTTFMVRWVDRDQPAASRELVPAGVAAGLGWDDADRPLGWQRTPGRAVRFAVLPDRVDITPLLPAIDADIGNATRAGDVLILSLRRAGAREVVAVSLEHGARLWSWRPGEAFLVRCAGDVRPPCFAVVQVDGAPQIRGVDPWSGTLDVMVPTPPTITDLAISPDGTELLISDGSPQLQRIQLTDPTLPSSPGPVVDLATIRGIAHDPRGGILAAGTKKTQLYQLVQVHPDGREEIVAQSSNDLMSVPRPSRDGRHVLILTRRYLPVLHELQGALP